MPGTNTNLHIFRGGMLWIECKILPYHCLYCKGRCGPHFSYTLLMLTMLPSQTKLTFVLVTTAFLEHILLCFIYLYNTWLRNTIMFNWLLYSFFSSFTQYLMTRDMNSFTHNSMDINFTSLHYSTIKWVINRLVTYDYFPWKCWNEYCLLVFEYLLCLLIINCLKFCSLQNISSPFWCK